MKLTRNVALAFGAIALTCSVNAQDASLTNKEGTPVLPEQGEFAVGFNAVPVLNWMGNMFNNTSNNTYISNNKFVSNLGNNVLFGKYMLESDRAIRAHLRIGVNNLSRDNYVIDDTKNHPDSMVMDNQKVTNQTYTIGGGYEFRRGKGRVQGIYGGDVFFMYSKYSENYEYGNAFGELNQAPTTTTNFGSGAASPEGERLMNFQSGGTFGLGVRPFVGVEYFFGSKMSIGGEFGWNIMFTNTGEGESTRRYYDPVSAETVDLTDEVAGSRSWNLDTDNFNGAIFLMFYF